VTSSEGVLIDRAERRSSQDRAEGAGRAARAAVPAQAGSPAAVTHAGQADGGGRSLAALAMAWLTVLMLRVRGGRRR
jgi:hypothetical protein